MLPSLLVITHWVTITNFIYTYIESQGLGFTLAREFALLADFTFPLYFQAIHIAE